MTSPHAEDNPGAAPRFKRRFRAILARYRGGPLATIPRQSRPVAWRGFFLLAVLIGSHSILETARDALFLADLSADHLPYAYLVIAAAATGVGFLHRTLGGFAGRSALVASLVVGSAITLAFGIAFRFDAGWTSPFALYVWSGLLATIVVVQFWLRIGDLLDVQTAKPVFAFVASGGLAGAASGSFLARSVVGAVGTEGLLFVAAAGLLVAAFLASSAHFSSASAKPATDERAPESAEEETEESMWGLLRAAADDVYLRRILLLSLLAPVAMTFVDYVFKAAVARQIAPDELGSFFATFHAVVNSFALLFQLLVVPVLLTRIGAIASLSLLPLLLALASGAFAFIGGLLPVLAMKSIDGAMRHSLHRASSEILYLPIASGRRATVKFTAESLGHRGGQALASLGLILMLGFGVEPVHLAVVTLSLAAAWAATCLGLRPHYVERFRSRLGDPGPLGSRDVPALELDTLETLIEALSAPRDDDVIAALELLEAYGREALVPGLILYHPSARVVLRALELLEPLDRANLSPLIARLIDHTDENVRAAALRTDSLEIDDEEVHAILRRDRSASVRAAAIARFDDEPGEGDTVGRLAAMLEEGGAETRSAVAQALPALAPGQALEIAKRLLRQADPALRREIASGLAERPHASFIPLLIDLLGDRETRHELRQALVTLGEPALEALAKRLDDDEADASIRRHLPRSISSFANPRAAEVLIEHLQQNVDPAIRYKILRGVGRIRADDPSVPIREAPLLEEAERSVRRAIEMLAARTIWSRLRSGSESDGDLLARLLDEKERRALERAFRILHILSPNEHFEAIWNGVLADDPKARAGSVELLLHSIKGELRDAVVAMFSAGDSDERLRRAAAVFPVGLAERALDFHANASDPEPGKRADADVAARRALASALANDHDPILVAVLEESGVVEEKT